MPWISGATQRASREPEEMLVWGTRAEFDEGRSEPLTGGARAGASPQAAPPTTAEASAAKSFQQSMLQEVVHSPLNEQLVAALGTAQAILPANGLAERLRLQYGTPLATALYRLNQALLAARSRYAADLNAALGGRPTEPGVASPFWRAGTLHVSEPDDCSRVVVHQDYSFDPAGFAKWYGTQGPVQAVVAQAVGTDVSFVSGNGFVTTGSSSPLAFSLTCDEAGQWHAQDSTLPGLGHVDLDHPKALRDPSKVAFLPGCGLVTPSHNFSTLHDAFDTWMPIAFSVVMAFAGAEVGSGFATSAGLTATAADGATVLSTAGVAASAGVSGAFNAFVGGVLSGNTRLRSLLQGALTGALGVELAQGVGALGGEVLQALGPAGDSLSAMTVQGLLQTLQGGRFEQGAMAGLASGLAQGVTRELEGGLSAALASQDITLAQAQSARFLVAGLGAAIKTLGGGASSSERAVASAFLQETLAQLGEGTPPVMAYAGSGS